MWCRTILTAVAITCTFTREIIVHAQDVICMLLLSGLQKEDLDANTLEKLARHNVNIDDKNNEKMRQECYAESENAHKNKESSRNGNLVTSTSKSDYKDINYSEYITLEMRVPTNIDNTTYIIINQTKNREKERLLSKLQELSESLQSNDELDNIPHLGTLAKIEENNGLQIEYVQNQPSLQSVLNFWTKLTHSTKKVVTKVVTTTVPPNTLEEQNSIKPETSHNTGYVHSREMEYIGRILAEYLASQTVPTATPKVATRKVLLSSMADNNELVKKTALYDLVKNLNSSLALDNEFNKAEELSETENTSHKTIYESHQQVDSVQLNLYPHMINSDMSQETKTTTNNPNYGGDEHTKIKINQDTSFKDVQIKIQDTPYFEQLLGLSTKSADANLNDNTKPTQLFDFFPEINSDVKINSLHITNAVSTTEITKLFNEENNAIEQSQLLNRYKKIPYNLNDVLKQNIKNLEHKNVFEMNINQFKSVTTEKSRNFVVNKQFRLTPTNTINLDQEPNTEIKNVTDTPIDLKNIQQPLNIVVTDLYKTIPPIIKKTKHHKNSTKSKSKSDKRVIKKFEPSQSEEKKTPAKNKKIEYIDPYKAMMPSIKNSIKNRNSRFENKEINFMASESKESLEIPNAKINNFKFRVTETTETTFNHIFTKNIEHYTAPAIVKPENRQKLSSQNTGPNTWSVLDEADHIETTKPQIKVKSKHKKKNGKKKKTKMHNKHHSQEVTHSDINLNNSITSQTISPNFIKEIAEKVKQIVLKDIRKETTTKSTPVTTTTTPSINKTTTSTTTLSTTEQPPKIQSQMRQANNVMHKLMEMFDQFEVMKEKMRATAKTPITSPRMQQLPVPTYKAPLQPFSPFMSKPQPILVKPVEVSPYGPNMVPIPISSGATLPKHQISQYVPPLKSQQFNVNQQRPAPITIQTNSEEIAPLAIQISKPLRLINQHIIVTTKSPFEKLREYHEREKKKLYGPEKYRGVDKVKIYKEQYKVHADVAKTDRLEESPTSDRYLVSSRMNSNREKPKYRLEYSEKIRDLHHLENSSHPGSLSLTRGLSFSEGLTNPAGLGYKGSLSDSNGVSNSGSLSYSGGISRTRGLSHPEVLSDSRRPTYSDSDPERMVRDPYNRPLARPDELSLHDRSYGTSDRERPRTRYEATKFHEKLERIEGWPRNWWKNYRDRRGRENKDCCNDIPSRQQLPITKVKKRTKFDDTHFKNFLKSQQKVTDMLEKILATNMKNNNNNHASNSVELP